MKKIKKNKKKLGQFIENYKVVTSILADVYDDNISVSKALSLCNDDIRLDVLINLRLCGYIEE